MNESGKQALNPYENASLFKLILAYFFPVYFNKSGRADINTKMLSVYATQYMLRNVIGAVLTFTVGEILFRVDLIVIGETFTALFVIFTGLCSVSLVAMVEARSTD